MICWSGDVLELWLDGTKTPWPVDGTLPLLSYKLRLWKPYNFLAKDCHKCHNFGFFEFRNDNCAPKSAWEKSDNKKRSMLRKRIVEAWQLHSALNKIHHCAVTNSKMDLNLQGCSRKCKNVDQSSSSTWSKKNAVNFTEQSKEPHLQKNSPLRAAIAVSWNERLQPTQKAFTIQRVQAGRMIQSAVLPFSLPGANLLGRKLSGTLAAWAASSATSFQALLAPRTQSTLKDLKDLRSCINDNGWFRHVALGAVVSPAAYAVMTSRQDFRCPYCSHPTGTWEHMAWHFNLMKKEVLTIL